MKIFAKACCQKFFSCKTKVLEEELCFGKLPEDHTARLKILFEEIDYDGSGCIDGDKAGKFNKFIEKRCSSSMASRDADDFIGKFQNFLGPQYWLFFRIQIWPRISQNSQPKFFFSKFCSKATKSQKLLRF